MNTTRLGARCGLLGRAALELLIVVLIALLVFHRSTSFMPTGGLRETAIHPPIQGLRLSDSSGLCTPVPMLVPRRSGRLLHAGAVQCDERRDRDLDSLRWMDLSTPVDGFPIRL